MSWSIGNFFAWSLLQLAIRRNTNNEFLKEITVESLKKVLVVNYSHESKAWDEILKDKLGEKAVPMKELNKMMGVDWDQESKHADSVFMQRLEAAIEVSLERIKQDGKHKFVPLLNVLMHRNQKTGDKSQFDDMSDDEFEYIFIEQCVKVFTYAENVVSKIIYLGNNFVK